MDLENGTDNSSEESCRVEKDRPTWGRSLEFLMSCLSLSVGLGNLWRFPATCFENGGAAFLIPYVSSSTFSFDVFILSNEICFYPLQIIILFLVGKPFYFLEMILGQFTSRGSMKAMEILPIMKGIGWGQQIASSLISTYYTAIIGLTLTYFLRSFDVELPWASCKSSWEDCYDSKSLLKYNNTAFDNNTSNKQSSSAEIFFRLVY
jgi:solute carrier family 6 (neurotransmitter transporter, glycine) member 5/9